LGEVFIPRLAVCCDCHHIARFRREKHACQAVIPCPLSVLPFTFSFCHVPYALYHLPTAYRQLACPELAEGSTIVNSLRSLILSLGGSTKITSLKASLTVNRKLSTDHSYPNRFSFMGSSLQSLLTLTLISRKTFFPTKSSMSTRAWVAAFLMALPLWPRMMAFCDSRITNT